MTILAFWAAGVSAQSPWGFTSPVHGAAISPTTEFTWAPYPGAAKYLFELRAPYNEQRFETTRTSQVVTIEDSGERGPIYARVEAFSADNVLLAADTAIYSDSPSIWGAREQEFMFVPITPCRALDTRLTAGPIAAGSIRNVPIASSKGGSCPLPNEGFVPMNITVVPAGPLSYITVWNAGSPQPLVSNLNSTDGRIKSNAAIVGIGNGVVSIFATDRTDVIFDNRDVPSASSLLFHPVPPCRVSDTRVVGTLGGPTMEAGTTRDIPVSLSNCGIPAYARANSLNLTAIPVRALGFLTLWPAGTPRPFVSTLNSPTGTTVANAALVQAGAGGGISVFVTDRTDVAIDINGYFAPPAYQGGMYFYGRPPCRALDTRGPNGLFGGPSLRGGEMRSYMLPASACPPPSIAGAFVTNATVIPKEPLVFLSLFAAGRPLPPVSTLSAFDGLITSNLAITQGNANAVINAYSTHTTDLVLDLYGYFAPFEH